MTGAAPGAGRFARLTAPGALRQAGIATALGLLVATGQAPLGWWFLALPALAGLFALGFREGDWRSAALVGWAGGAGHFAGALFWIVEPFFIDPWRHGWLAPLALIVLPGGLALFWGAAFGLARRLAPGRRGAALAAVLLAGAEASRAYVLTGFPWAQAGHVWIDTPLAQTAALGGPHGLTLLTTLAAALAALAAWPGRFRWAGPAVACAALALGWIWGAARLSEPVPPRAAPVFLRLVQPNAEQRLKWDEDLAAEFLRRLLAGTAAAPEGPAPDAVIWPETAVPYLLNGAEALVAEIAAAAGGRTVAFGVVRRDGARLYNSLAVTGPDGTVAQLYDKYHLVPFGEYVPFGEVLARVGIRGLATSQGDGFSPGPGPRLLDFGVAGRALPLICYEAIFPQHLRVPERPDWVLQATNDAWFGEINGPYQHLAQARLRAIEQGLPVVRVANTGVSAVIDGHGRVTASLGLGEEGFLDAALPAALPPTPYARMGDLPVLALLAALAFMLGLPWRRKSH